MTVRYSLPGKHMAGARLEPPPTVAPEAMTPGAQGTLPAWAGRLPRSEQFSRSLPTTGGTEMSTIAVPAGITNVLPSRQTGAE